MANDPNEWSTFRLTNRNDSGAPPHTAVPADEGPDSDSQSVERIASDPNFLEMAMSASRSLARFAAAGFRAASEDVQAKRMAQCQACTYLEETRCRICGCFADKKAMMPHEDCPIGRWPV